MCHSLPGKYGNIVEYIEELKTEETLSVNLDQLALAPENLECLEN